MFSGLSEMEQGKIKDLINQLLAVNFLLKETDREKYLLAKRNQEALTSYFKFLGWDFVFDDRNECIALHSPRSEHRLRLKRDESIFLLILRLFYQEKRASLSLSQYPIVSLREIRSKYDSFRLPFVNKSQLIDMIKLLKRYNLIAPLDADWISDECRFRLLHTFLHVVDVNQLSVLVEMIKRYDQGEEQIFDEVDEEVTVD